MSIERPFMATSRQAHFIAAAVLCVAALCVLGLYVNKSIQISGGELIMPLDDTYIHFQYARQLADGQPYRYNPGDPPSSGATSLLYPYLLAPGYALGFTGFDLGFWAMAIGTLALCGSALIIYWFAKQEGLSFAFAIALSVLFVASGAISWHFMSGMETGLVVMLTLATLYAYHTGQLRAFSISAALLATARPEGSLMTLVAVGLTFVALVRQQQVSEVRKLIWLLLPLAAAFTQPLLNVALTGNVSASGTQVKSILSTVPSEWSDVLTRIAENFTRIWIELATGTNNRYVAIPMVILAFAGFVRLAIRKPSHRHTALLITLWMLVVTAGVATLETAFWHFKRYQIPLMALQYPLAATGLVWLLTAIQNSKFRNAAGVGIIGVTAAITLLNALEFLRLYEVNLENMESQPLAMAQWLQQNTEASAIVAVHDIGVMRYIGDRYTVDMVGLTTPDAAEYWRNGPGSVAEFLLTYEPHIDYVAAYTTARGLNYLAETSIYGALLQGFSANYDPADNVALGAEFQGIFSDDAPTHYPSMLETYYMKQLRDGSIIDLVNVADIHSENAHAYHWQNGSTLPGFATEVYEMNYAGCSADCQVIDGGRLINGAEEFEVSVQPNADNYLITRVHPFNSGTYDVYVNERFIATRVIPEIPGRWLDIATLIPGHVLASNHATVRIVPSVASGAYMPYRHLIVLTQDRNSSGLNSREHQASFQKVGQIDLVDHNITFEEESKQLTADFTWSTNGEATGDYKFFLHIYDNPDVAPIAQVDRYVADSMPVGNWLSGTIEDTITMDLSQLPQGQYKIAIGFYEAQSFQRLEPLQVASDLINDEANRRLFLSEINIPS